jgi:hypothetical protein
MNRIVIEYENFDDWQDMLNKLFSFLGVERKDMLPVLTKTSSNDWRKGVENFKEIENVLQDSYRHYLG